MRAFRRRWIVAAVAVLLATGLTIIGLRWFHPHPKREAVTTHKPEAPPDLQNLRDRYLSGLAAIHDKDGAKAASTLGSFSFRGRVVEQYRLYYLARAYELQNDPSAARRVYAELWQREPQAVIADDIAQRLAALYTQAGDFASAARVYDELAGGTAQWGAIASHFYDGDIDGAVSAAHAIAIKTPRVPQAVNALAVMQTTGSTEMTATERLERGVSLMRDGDPQHAYDELTALDSSAPASLRDPIQLNRGLTLNQLRRYDESNKLLEPMAGGPFKYAIPAIATAAKNYGALSASINPIVVKQITVRQKVGNVKVGVGKGKKKKLVTRPKYANVKKNIQLVDLAKKAKKDAYDRLATERLKDLLQIQETAPEVRLDTLNTLIAVAQAKHQDAYLQQLVPEVVKINPFDDPALQYFWDKAWTAYAAGDLNGAKPLLRFIADTYTSPNVKRQAEYWYARIVDRQGDKATAAATYQSLASAPYEDVYALYSEAHGAKHVAPATNPIASNREDWREIAERSMPPELRLAYELTALQDFNDAAAELAKNAKHSNQKFADALTAEKLSNDGNLIEMYKALRRAWPLLATVEQDSVPPYFLEMYYPVKYRDAILRYSSRYGLDPYFVMALILQESYFNPRAKSRVGATGLMQIMPATGAELGAQLHPLFSVKRLTDPDTNIEIGTFHLQHLMALFSNNPQLVAASFNAGQGNVLKWRRGAPHKPMDEFLESIPFSETRNYVKRVTILRSAYSRIAK
ncbi:MAG TPA: lytic transglycosylase domain-containing protein [Thermoanaerobaculia bacterium]|jgi:soluble lytic murein transglycosylase-like protein|nr:lytic transglycosylase domain-containing protein [Thermoanaerobaculia bacterium]